MSFKKVLLACITTASLAFGGIALVGCGGQSDEDVIREGIATDLDAVKNLDEDFLAEIVASTSSSDLEEVGIDATELMKAYFGGFDYTIEDVTVDGGGNTAVATVTITCKTYGDLINSLTDAMMSVTDETEIAGAVMDAVNNLAPTKSDPIELGCEKVNDSWQLTSEGETALASALLAA